MATGQTDDLGARTHPPSGLGAQSDFTAQPLDAPFSGNESGRPRKLTHFRKAGAGDPMWSGQCVYGLSGFDPSFSEYDSPDPYGTLGDNLDYHVRAGVVTTKSLRDADEPTMTRETRVSAHFDSSPAARFFQGFANVRWSGVLAGFGVAPRALIRPRPLAQSNNPNAWGSKELHPATQYKPFPPMGSIVPAYGEMKAL